MPDIQVKGNRCHKACQPIIKQLLGKAGHQGRSQHGRQHTKSKGQANQELGQPQGLHPSKALGGLNPH